MPILYILAAVVIIVALVVAGIALVFLNLWIQARASGVRVGIVEMLMMRLRGLRPANIIHALITLEKAGMGTSAANVEAHLLAGGNIGAVVRALISAAKADLDVSFDRIAGIDLAGRDVVDAVETHVNPKVLLCPAPEDKLEVISGVCQDGIRIGSRARITVRTRLDRLVGGAGESTIVARVGEGIVAAIGRAAKHTDILENPDRISRYLLERSLDSGTTFEIISVDIADVDVLDNIGARLQSVQAETDKRIAQARAEMRRAAAVAVHQEMQARTTKSQGQVVAARAGLPLAEASALQETNMGRRRPYMALLNHAIRWQRVQPAAR